MIGILIPAHNEEALLEDCLQAALRAAQHELLGGETVEVLVVLGSCTDRSSDIVGRYPVHCLHIDARNVGQARAAGARFLDRGVRWISCSDADSRVAHDWLVAQLSLVPTRCAARSPWASGSMSRSMSRRRFTITNTIRPVTAIGMCGANLEHQRRGL